jgi:hypothetical protein
MLIDKHYKILLWVEIYLYMSASCYGDWDTTVWKLELFFKVDDDSPIGLVKSKVANRERVEIQVFRYTLIPVNGANVLSWRSC